jgi:dTDP-L-rhamnose 4-epimerase
VEDLDLGNFEPRCPACGEFVLAEATKENCPLSPSSFYGLTKRVQEEMILLFAKAKNIKGIALRYQNVYGPGQSLINPYTGILAVFSNLARAGKPIQVFEDGKESRDFVYVEDVASATSDAVLSSSIVTGAYNVGSGVSTDVATVARLISEYFGSKAPIILTGAYRLGDIRHNYASIDSLNMDTKFMPKWNFADGLKEFLDWAVTNELQSNDAFTQSLNEMREKGFYRGT